MPAYGSLFENPSIAPGDSFQAWNAEQPAAGNGGASASQQVALARGAGIGKFAIFEGFFSGAPGTFEIDCQGAEVDMDTQYQTMPGGNITTVDATNNTFLYQAPYVPKFARFLMRARANAVNVTGTISEQ